MKVAFTELSKRAIDKYKTVKQVKIHSLHNYELIAMIMELYERYELRGTILNTELSISDQKVKDDLQIAKSCRDQIRDDLTEYLTAEEAIEVADQVIKMIEGELVHRLIGFGKNSEGSKII